MTNKRMNKGSDAYNEQLGLMRTMFKIEDPDSILVIYDTPAKVWVKEETSWRRVF